MTLELSVRARDTDVCPLLLLGLSPLSQNWVGESKPWPDPGDIAYPVSGAYSMKIDIR
jgi:hypothetical protein